MMNHDTYRAIKNLYAVLKELDDQGVLESHEDTSGIPFDEAEQLLNYIQVARDGLFRDSCMGNLQN
jgi:hypothetical protein